MKKKLYNTSFILSIVSASVAQDTISVVLNPSSTGLSIAPDFAGLAFEKTALNRTFFSPTKDTLLTLFKTLGIKSLRIGGNSVEKDTLGYVTNTTHFTRSNIDSIFEFAQLANCKVIMGLNLGGFNPTLADSEVTYTMQKYASNVSAFEIGNEPDLYFTNSIRANNYHLPEYKTDYNAYYNAITLHNPTAKFAAPAAFTFYTTFTIPFAYQMQGKFSMITQHYYIGAANIASAHKQISTILSAATLNTLNTEIQQLVVAADSVHVPLRLAESNTFYNGGQWQAGNSFASALWVLDYMYAVAKKGCQGVNIHGSFWGKYTVLEYLNNVYKVRPIGYGILAFQVGSHGSFIHSTVTNNHINLNTYSVKDSMGNVFLTIINKDTLENAVLNIDGGTTLFVDASAITLTSPSIYDTATVTLGGQVVDTATGTIPNYTWQVLSYSQHLTQVAVPAGSAMIVKFKAPPTGIKEQETSKAGFQLFPNPFSSQTTLVFDEEQKNTVVKITDELGAEIRTINFTGKQLTIDKAEMQPGVYFLQVSNINQLQSRRSVKIVVTAEGK